jgi:hypothetical protein
MSWIETRVLKDPWDVDRRLAELGLNRAGLLAVRDVALGEAANATPHHCANAWGTFSYQQGTWALRDRFVGPRWAVDRIDGVEAIFNKDQNIRVAFCNVDVACREETKPKPRSDKGAGSERACEGNLFGHLPHFAPVLPDRTSIFYLMVAENGACELSRPVIGNGTFAFYIEQIYLSDGCDFDAERPSLNDDDAVTDFDPMIVRKT